MTTFSEVVFSVLRVKIAPWPWPRLTRWLTKPPPKPGLDLEPMRHRRAARPAVFVN